MRIIRILHHSLSPFWHTYEDPGKSVFYSDEELNTKFAREFARRWDGIEQECWRPEKSLKHPISYEVDGIVHRVFPSHYLRFGYEISLPMLRHLRNMNGGKKVTILELHGFYNYLAHSIVLLGTGCKLVAQSHGGLPGMELYRRSKKKFWKHFHLVNHLWEKIVFPRYDQIFVLNRAEERAVKSLFPVKRLTRSTTGVDTEKFFPGDKKKARVQCGLSADRPIILFVGRLEKLKGLDFLIAALPEVLEKKPDALLLIIGRGSYDPDLRKEVQKANLGEKVRFLGALPPGQLPDWYRAADVLAFPSIYEGLGLVAVEAMLCGTPVVAALNDGSRDTIGTMKGGVIVPAEDGRSLAEGICRVLDEPEKYRPEREKGNVFGWNHIVPERVRVYHQLWEESASAHQGQRVH